MPDATLAKQNSFIEVADFAYELASVLLITLELHGYSRRVPRQSLGVWKHSASILKCAKDIATNPGCMKSGLARSSVVAPRRRALQIVLSVAPNHK